MRDHHDVKAFVYVKRTRASVPESSVIIQSVRDIGALLYLHYHRILLDRMDSTRSDLEEIAALYRNFSEKIIPPVFVDHLLGFLAAFRIVPYDDRCVPVTVHNVPAFRFAGLSVFVLYSIFVIGMNLNAESIPGIYDFYDKRKVAV